MNIKLYNTLARKKQNFIPINSNRVTMYICGPTVYSYPHIGNARGPVIFDILAGLLRREYELIYVRNITDLDDKIYEAAKSEQSDVSEITERYTKIYHQDISALGVKDPDIEPRATDHIKEMIEKWSYEKFDNSLEYVFKGKNEFVDERGKISNYELPEPINLIGYIESKKGTIRANHFHPIQEQKCLLVKGQFISIYKDLLNKNSIKVTHVVNEGDMIVTKPNVAHTMVFTKDSIFLNLVRGEREHKNYGITHTLPYKLVNEAEGDLLSHIYKFDCRCCGSNKLKRVLSLGYQPLANNLLDNKNQKAELYPLELNVCEKCFNCQLSVVIDSDEMCLRTDICMPRYYVMHLGKLIKLD